MKPSCALVARQSNTRCSGFRRSLAENERRPCAASRGAETAYPCCFRLEGAEGERFELSIRLTTDNGFRDRRIRPLCHPSGTTSVSGTVGRRRDVDGARLRAGAADLPVA